MVIESCSMNPSPKGEFESYYDCTLGSAMTPTMVSNFNLPNSNVNKDGPYLKILEQPQTKFRFRYKSEMVGTHGQLKAESSDKNKNVFPTVQLCNWNQGPALIRLMLYTAEDNANERKRHVHELNGKNCNKEGFTGGCEVVVDEDNNYTAQFPNLGIIHIAKRDVQNIIFLRKKEELINYTCMNNPGLRTESIQHNIPPTKLQKMKEEAEEEARNMDLNKVVLRFQTFFFDTKANFYRPITECVDSDVIFNLKNASTGELKIVRISAVSSPCTGGTEVWMLVEKVKKNNVRIKFYELDKDNQEVWKGYGEFKESDVHHQYAIVFRTPAYRSAHIREPVHVKVQLERTTDNDTSEPLEFTFLPENLKRTNAYLDSRVESEVSPQKRVRSNDIGAINLHKELFLGPRDSKQHGTRETSPFQSQSPPHMVPSPMTPADSPASYGLYSPPHQGSHHNPPITISSPGEEIMILTSNNEDSMGVPVENPIEQQMRNLQQSNPTYQIAFGEPGHFQRREGDQPPFYQSCYQNPQELSPHCHQVPSPGSNGQSSPHGGNMSPYSQGGLSPSHNANTIFYQNYSAPDTDSADAQIQQFDEVQKQVIHSKNQVSSPHQWDFSDLVRSPENQISQTEDIDLLDIISNTTIFSASKDVGDIQADSAPSKGSTKRIPAAPKADVDLLSDKLSRVTVDEKAPPSEPKETVGAPPSDKGVKKEPLENKDLAYRVGVTTADSLHSYTTTGDVRLLLATHRLLLAVQNENGDNSLHIAISNKNHEAFEKLLNASTKVYCSDLLTAQNYFGETPLHLAIKANEMKMVKSLLMASGCNVNSCDDEGNTAVHLASMKRDYNCLNAILSQPCNGKGTSPSKSINLYNYHGQTPLHLAVKSGCFENVKSLIESGALVHLCEKKQGANALHLAAMLGHADIAKFLIEKTSITVDAGLFDGNTALHIAAQAKDAHMCSILIGGKANPHAKNSLKNPKARLCDEDDEGDDETEDEEVGSTPIDYAENDSTILSILTDCKEDRSRHRSQKSLLAFTTDV